MTRENSQRLRSERTRSAVLLTNLLQYGVALVSVILALVSTLLLNSYLLPTPTPLFFAAIIISAWYGGLAPGIFATILSMLAINFFLLEPLYALSTPDPGVLVRSGVFLLVAILINSLNASQRAARKKAEASLRSLRQSEARFGCLAESNIIGMIVAELDGAILEANQNFLQMVGYTQEELRAGRLNWCNMTPSESLEGDERAIAELQTTGACVPFEKEYIRKDGSRVTVLHGAVMAGEATVIGFVLDLSERKRIEIIQQEAIRRERELYAEVQAANTQLETVLSSLKDQFLVLDQEWRYIYVSDRVVEVTKKSREELLGQCIWDLFPETIDSEFYAEVHRAVAERQIVQFEYFYTALQRWFENRIYPSATGVSILVTDITDRKRAEESLQRTNQTLQTLLDACPVAIVFFDPQGIVRLWNRAAERIFGWSAAEAIGQFMPTVPHRSQEFLANLQTVLSGQSLNGLETQHQRKDGQTVDLEIWANLIHDAEGNLGCLGIAWNITERKRVEAALRQSEERFRLIAQATNDVVWDCDLLTHAMWWSERVQLVFGYQPEELGLDRSGWAKRLHPDDLARVQASYETCLNSSETVWTDEYRFRQANGSYADVLDRAFIIRDSASKPVRIVGAMSNITDRKQAEIEREQLLAREQAARQEAETANRIKDEFLAVLSHELRSPLNPILGWAKLLQTQKLDEQKTQQALITIERNAKLQTQLIDDLLDVSRILRGKLVLNVAPVSLISTVEDALETVKLAVEAKGIQIHKSFNLDLDRVMGDAARLQQVVWNLLSNAVKFTPNGGQVEVRLEKVIGNRPSVISEAAAYSPISHVPVTHYAQIIVTDTGKGISPEFLPYAFDYFRQEDGTTTRKFGGLGLGLAIVQHITELHGGTVWADSPGEEMGATFTVQLPLLTSQASAMGNQENQVDTSPPAPLSLLTGIRVLAVDDDADIRELIEFTLQQAGAEVCVVASATEVLQRVEVFSPDIFISDIGMPDFDGYMLMQQLKTLIPEGKLFPAIALTAYARDFDQQQVISAGFQMHIPKPVEPGKLIDAIVMLLNQHSADKLE